MTEETQDTAIELVSSDLCGELIALLGDRLTAGELLIAPAHFQKADGTEGEAQGCNVFTIRDGKFHDLRSYFDPSDFSD